MTVRYACALVAVVFQISSAAGVQNPQPPSRNRNAEEIERLIAGKEQLPAEEVFKNIRLFTGMPAIRVLRIMEQAFVPNLGVECSHCHTPGEWDSDAKREKIIAREMWTLRSEVQQKLRQITGKSDLPLTCYTCHKGRPKPAFAPE
jgi:hypothetical protein